MGPSHCSKSKLLMPSIVFFLLWAGIGYDVVDWNFVKDTVGDYWVLLKGLGFTSVISHNWYLDANSL